MVQETQLRPQSENSCKLSLHLLKLVLPQLTPRDDVGGEGHLALDAPCIAASVREFCLYFKCVKIH